MFSAPWTAILHSVRLAPMPVWDCSKCVCLTAGWAGQHRPEHHPRRAAVMSCCVSPYVTQSSPPHHILSASSAEEVGAAACSSGVSLGILSPTARHTSQTIHRVSSISYCISHSVVFFLLYLPTFLCSPSFLPYTLLHWIHIPSPPPPPPPAFASVGE